jgi:hypothetical protein
VPLQELISLQLIKKFFAFYETQRLIAVVFLNNQKGALIIQIYCYETLYVSCIFSAHHQEFSTVHSALVSSILTLLGSGNQKPA